MTYPLERDMKKNTTNEPEPQPEPMPTWWVTFLAVASVAVVLACGLLGNSDTEDKINAMKWSTPESLLEDVK